jgi:hypothetical protein
MFLRQPFARTMSLVFFPGFVLAAGVYPLRDSWLPAILLAYGALLWWRPALWLLALPPLLPALDLAPHTGWFFLEEIDLLLLLTAGFCYWHLDRLDRRHAALPRFAPLFRISLMLLAVAVGIGFWRGLRPLPAIDANAFNNYLSSYNALRVGKAWLWALILLPPLKRTAGAELEGLRRLLMPGMLAGLLLVSCAAIRERVLFPGLLNFSSDYRITAPFSAMHTGGAALDGYLALSFPLLAAWLLGRQATARQTAAMILLPLALYAGLATFSRGLYLAYTLTVVVLLGVPLRARLHEIGSARFARRYWRPALAVLAAVLLLGWMLDQVFRSSGYRGFGAALALLTAALLLSSQALRPVVLISGVICGLALAGLLAWLLPAVDPTVGWMKPPYLLFMCSALAFAAALLRARVVLPLAAIAFAGLLFNAAWIAYHHAGVSTLRPSAGLLLMAVSPVAWNLVRSGPIWRPSRRLLSHALAGALVLAAVVPIINGYFVGERFATSSGDLATRVRHWNSVLTVMDDDLPTVLLGAGLGKFPALYFWRNPAHEVPPAYRYLDQAGNRYLRLATADYPAGYGEMLRMLQIVQVQPGTPYLLALDVRNGGPPAFLHVNLCERQLLYPQGCVAVPLRQVGGPAWQRLQFTIAPSELGRDGAPVQLAISTEGEHAALDIDNVSLRGVVDNHELVRNGDFSEANTGWFFSSDHHHLPWHIKNLGLNLYFEMGWPGLLAYTGMLFSTCLALLAPSRSAAGAPPAVWLASLLAFQVVGLFDSLFDVPRITLLFMLVLFAAALQPATPRSVPS